MFLHVQGLLDAEQLKALDAMLATATYMDGAASGGFHGGKVKSNKQVDWSKTEGRDEAINTVVEAMTRNDVIRAAIMPKRVMSPLFSKYEPGMTYGWHTDNPVMYADRPVRSDVSCTVFLSDPDSYDGGELVALPSTGEVKIKLPKGDAVLYPSTLRHTVAEVTEGERLAAVTWIQSLVADGAKRELLMDLNTIYKLVSETKDPSQEAGNLITKTYSNLMRMWADV